MSQGIIAIAEQADGTLRKSAEEVCSEAVRLGATSAQEVCALLVGPGATQAASQLGDLGVPQALVVEDESLASYSGEATALALAEAIRPRDPKLVLIAATTWGRDLLGRLGAHLGVSPASDCIAIDWNGGDIRVRRPVYAGKALLTVSFATSPAIASLRPNVFAAQGGRGIETSVESLALTARPEHRANLVERTAAEGGKVDLGEAAIVVAGGRGLKDPETFAGLIEPLAEALGAAVGASRAVVDAGWRPHSEQVGQTGKTVSPTLYFACGISGAIQHLAGMRTSQTIVAINKDKEAPIFKVADYGIVGDVTEVLTALAEQVGPLLAK